MIRLEAPPDGTDRIYARSLFELVESQGGREKLEELAGELDELADMVRSNPRLGEFIANKTIAADKKEASLRKMFEGKISPVLFSTIGVLNRKGRLGQFLRVGAAFQELVEQKFGRIEVDVYTRFPLPPDEADKLRNVLRDRLKREPVLYSYTDPTMIGGFKLRVGDRLLDASFKTRLGRIKDQLRESGGKQIRARFDRAVQDDGAKG
jgi:F-type H+-transporting ATPase subunit delta